jgi:tetratricopeptide (TPR) repeat protein
MRSQALAVFLVVCLSCTRALQQPAIPSAPAPAARGVAILDHSRSPLSLEQLQPAEIPAAFDAAFRLMPDRRVLNAVADVYELSTDKKAPSVEIDFRDNAWQIRCAREDVGSLPELASFDAALNLLTEWSAHLRAQRHAAPPLPASVLAQVNKEIEAFAPMNLLAVTALIAKHSSGRPLDPTAAARAAHAVTLLAAQTYDWFELQDGLNARSLALLALARQSSSECCRDDEALIARMLGYSKEAESIATTLPPATFASAFVLDTPVDAKADGNAFAWLRTRSALRKGLMSGRTLTNEWASLLNEIGDFGEQVPASHAAQSLILKEVESGRPADRQTVIPRDGEGSDVVGAFERALPRRIVALRNAILDDATLRSYYESNFYAAIFKEFAFHQYSRYDHEAVNEFIASMGKPQTDAGSQVVTWMKAFRDATFDAAHATKSLNLSESLKSMPLAGCWRREELLRKWNEALTTRVSVRKAAAELYKELDWRPVDIYTAGQISGEILNDPLHRERYIRAAIDRNPFVSSWGPTAWYLFQAADREALRSRVDHAPTDADRADALSYLAKLGDMDSASVHHKFEEILQGKPSIGALSQYAMYLNERGEAATKERFMRQVLERNRGSDDAIYLAWIASSLANALDRQGKYDEAWTVVKPHVRVYSANVLMYAASILQHLGRLDEANELGRGLVERYPEESSRGTFAELLWREGRFEDAAALFDPAKAAYSVNEALWDLSEKFVNVFKDTPIPNALDAYIAFIKTGVNSQILTKIPEKAVDEHRPQLALALVERLLSEPAYSVARFHPESISALRSGYRATKDLKGPETALAWLDSKIPPAGAMQALIVFYQTADYDLVQRYASLVGEKNKSNEVATLEAASLLMLRVPHTDERWQKLEPRIAGLSTASTLPPMAKYLTGTIDENTFFAAANTKQNHADIEYFAGVKAISRNEYDRALPLMIAATFAADDYPPAAWAAGQLSTWNESYLSWQTIAKGAVNPLGGRKLHDLF